MDDLAIEGYTAPTIHSLGSVEEMTMSNDKIGSIVDDLTPTLGLDGCIVPDGVTVCP